MSTRKRILIAVPIIIFIALWMGLGRNCPNVGIALTSNARRIHRLKNRTAVPQAADFDTNVTLDALLQPGNDRDRWSTDRAARIQGQVIDVAYAGLEATNCYHPCRRDIHILLATRKEAAKTEQVVLEVTAGLRELAEQQKMNWSEEKLKAQLIGHWCEFEGWLYFDVDHDEEAENTNPQRPANWRATSWEIHPVTKITVIR
jgi:hypothetical protein